MMLSSLLERVQTISECKINPVNISVQTWRGLELPEDMQIFYSKINGFVFDTNEYWFEFFALNECGSVNDRGLFDELCAGEINSNSWCIFASQQGAFIAIDLDKKRFGRCYYVDFGMDTHILAFSFTEMVTRILDNNGNYPEWYALEYKPIVDICDF